jgi:hypothetical protein
MPLEIEMKNPKMNLIPVIVSAVLLCLPACAPAAPGMPITGSEGTATSVVENTLTSVSTSVQLTLTPTSLAPTVVNPTATSPTGDVAERITFAAGSTSATITGNLRASGSDKYVLGALAGQTMSVDLSFSAGRAILVVWGADGTVILTDHVEAPSFQRVVPTTQDYFIRVKGSSEGSTTYSMTVSIPSISTSAERIEFASGSTSATVTGQLNATEADQYVLHALAGQTMSADTSFSEGGAILVVWGADGTVLLSDHAEVSSFQRVLPATQDYYIRVRGRPEGNTTYNMTVSLPPLP